MATIIQVQGLSFSSELRAHLVRRFTFALYRFENRIQSTELFVRDGEGKGTFDKHVLAKVHLPGRGPVIVGATAHDVFVAVSLAARRCKRAVKRALREQQNHRRDSLRALVPADGRTATEFA